MNLTNGNAAKRKRVWTTNCGAMATCRSGRRGMDLAGLPVKPVQLSSQYANGNHRQIATRCSHLATTLVVRAR